MSFLSIAERQVLAAITELAVREDLGVVGDVTSNACIPESAIGKAAFVSRREGILAGMPVLERVIERMAPSIQLQPLLADGTTLQPGYWIATVEGSLRSILALERTALNFVQHLSGIASLTHQFVDAVAGTNAMILDTRKTLPGWRLLEKYAVRVGGGQNHRVGLFDAVLIKDNHLAALRKTGTGNEIVLAIRRCREASPSLVIEVEVDSLDQLELALPEKPDIILLDNMSHEQLRTAVHRRNEIAPPVKLEASGGIRLDNVHRVAATGVDRISVGALTHSAPALDIALDYCD